MSGEYQRSSAEVLFAKLAAARLDLEVSMSLDEMSDQLRLCAKHAISAIKALEANLETAIRTAKNQQPD